MVNGDFPCISYVRPIGPGWARKCATLRSQVYVHEHILCTVGRPGGHHAVNSARSENGNWKMEIGSTEIGNRKREVACTVADSRKVPGSGVATPGPVRA